MVDTSDYKVGLVVAVQELKSDGNSNSNSNSHVYYQPEANREGI